MRYTTQIVYGGAQTLALDATEFSQREMGAQVCLLFRVGQVAERIQVYGSNPLIQFRFVQGARPYPAAEEKQDQRHRRKQNQEDRNRH